MTFTSGVVRTLACCAALGICMSPDALAQQKHKISFKIDAKDAKYPQRHVIDVGDVPGHQVNVFEIYRKFPADAPMIAGSRIKESWTRGYGDYVDNNGLSINYTTYVLESGDKVFSMGRTMGQAESGKRKTVSVGELRGGTGKATGIQGIVRSTGASDGKAGINETSAEIEYWLPN